MLQSESWAVTGIDGFSFYLLSHLKYEQIYSLHYDCNEQPFQKCIILKYVLI